MVNLKRRDRLSGNGPWPSHWAWRGKVTFSHCARPLAKPGCGTPRHQPTYFDAPHSLSLRALVHLPSSCPPSATSKSFFGFLTRRSSPLSSFINRVLPVSGHFLVIVLLFLLLCHIHGHRHVREYLVWVYFRLTGAPTK